MSNLFNPDSLQHLSAKYGFRPGRGYGQNFLIDENVIEKIIAAANIGNEDTVVEVGPGFGVLTFALAARAKQVVAFEIEKKLQPYWKKEIVNKKLRNLEIVWGNVLKEFLISNFSRSKRDPDSPSGQFLNYKVVANLPYQITSPVIRLFLESEFPPTELVLMVQKEVAERITAAPGQMSVLAVATQYYADCEYLFTVPRASFWPSPRVDSAVVRLRLRTTDYARLPRLRSHCGQGLQTKIKEQLFKLVKAGFANKRKKLFNNLLPIIGKTNRVALARAWADLGLGENARAQELSVEEWVALAKCFDK